MKTEVTPIVLSKIKAAAKRLKKHLPEKSHTELLDIASHLIVGVSDFNEANALSQAILAKRPEREKERPFGSSPGQTVTYGQKFGLTPSFKRGDWYFYPDQLAVVFDGELSPYVQSLSRIGTTAELLDFILQIQKKKWPADIVKKNNISPDYQVDEFISLMNDLCEFYFESSIQGVFSPGGGSRDVDWSLVVKDKLVVEKSGG